MAAISDNSRRFDFSQFRRGLLALRYAVWNFPPSRKRKETIEKVFFCIYLSHLEPGVLVALRHLALEFAHGAQAAPHFAMFIDRLFGLSPIAVDTTPVEHGNGIHG